MQIRKVLFSSLAVTSMFAMLPVAFAHVSVEGPGFADKNQVVTFRIGHGCAGSDTFRLEIHLPESVTSVRAMPSAFGDPEIVLNDQLLPSDIIWEKTDVKATDDQYYEFQARMKVPDAAFTTIYFPATQVCRDGDGVETIVEWNVLPPETEGEPAAPFAIVPPRFPGWNKYEAPAAIADLSTYFGDAQIVWVGDAAYSANPSIMELIAAEDDVTELTAIEAGAEIWVKY